MKVNIFLNKLDQMIPDPKCELKYKYDYELLIATILSAQSTDKRVNEVTERLFQEYNIFSLGKASICDIEKIIKRVGAFQRKSFYIVECAKRLVKDYEGIVPNNRDYLESLPGVGRKTCNVVISNLFDEPAIAVDTHVKRVSKRLKIALSSDNELTIEKKLMKYIPKGKWSRAHHQLVLFGRYICQARKPKCEICLFKKECKKSLYNK